MKHTKILVTAVSLIIVGFFAAQVVVAAEKINFVSWGGVYEKSQVEAYIKPYTAKTGVEINVMEYSGGIAEIKAQVESGKVSWQLVDMLPGDLARACEEGLLHRIDPSILPPGDDGTPARDDFIAGGLHECGVGTVSWSTVMAYNKDSFKGAPPKTVADFWNVKKFPGKRALRKAVDVNLEWALIADGVPRDKVYEVLATAKGLDQAFNSLNKIKDHVIWWESGAQPPKLLAGGEVVLASAFNGRFYDAIVNEGQPLVIMWGTQIWDLDLWAIPMGAKNKTAVLEFVKFATGTKPLADGTNYISYGPLRKSSAKYVNPNVLPYLPTAPDNIQDAIRFNVDFWSENKEEINERFVNWLKN